ncbi:F-box protein At4g22280 [Cajanus cajan]|uniref:F-box protein At4g22280 n=1 Tax=Cajanus cajan TaxID=3821 RepID=UPI00098D8374|nr:F-box protein At4g22280 [Cajanus cajan]
MTERKVFKIAPQHGGGSVDRLSELSEGILLHILSRLDTKEAAVTSILSTAWRNLFLSVPEIRLCFSRMDAFERGGLFPLFTRFANRVLQERNDAPIKGIRLNVEFFNERFRPSLESLFSTVAHSLSTHKVQVVCIIVDIDSLNEFDEFEPCTFIKVPRGMFSSETLVHLHLHVRVAWDVPKFVWLPNLKFLHLISLRLVDQDSVPRLLQGCPLLENLILVLRSLDEFENGEEAVQVDSLSIFSPSLKWLMFVWQDRVESNFSVFVTSENLESFSCELEGPYKVTLDAPKLKSLNLYGEVFEFNMTQKLVSIVEALYLYPSVPTLTNLIKLELKPDYTLQFDGGVISRVLLNLFECSPNLEVLIFNTVSDVYFGDGDYFDSVLSRALPLSFVEHLKVIELNKFRYGELEFKLVEYFLKNGKSLEKIAIGVNDWEFVPKHRNKILSFEKCSEDCQIVFR